MKNFIVDGENLTLQNLMHIAYHPGLKLQLSEESKIRMKKSRKWVDQVQKQGTPVVYGVNTGFGSKATVSIDKEKLKDLQRNLIMSHSAGLGNPLAIEVVRSAMLMRVNTIAKGYSGVRIEVAETILDMLEKGVTPWIPEQGSLGASGDLAPLSHMALVISRGVVRDKSEDSGQAYFYDAKKKDWILMSGLEAMKKAGIPRIVLEAKEGLALNNGTQISTSILAVTLHRAQKLLKLADIAMAMTLEALEGISSAFREEIHQLRPHPGQISTARNIRRLNEGSQLLDRHPEKVQDAYSLRCHPQVLAGVRDALRYIGDIVHIEFNATTDNPIILPELSEKNKAISGGNFHAQPIAFAADHLAMVLCEIGSISERRIFRMSDKHLNSGLPSFLIENGGLESGLMMAQYTAAALVSENKTLAHPASIDSIPTCENQEDHVSMAPIAARKALDILQNVEKIVAIELFFAAQALDLRLKQNTGHAAKNMFGKGTLCAYNKIREYIPFFTMDRPLYPHIESLVQLLQNGELLTAVEGVIGELS
ncbi:MAG: histidine ammonia-lyase [bacterium]|nr:MAG: histidine ammonia-lyase [bacterium]